METLIQKPAPAFKAQALVGEGFKEISLADYKGKWLCLFFYPLDFTFVCPTEITAFSDMAAQFRENNCEVVGCSVDSQFSHLAWSQRPRNEGGLGKLDIPLLADIKKEIARDYGVLIESAGVALRGCYLIDPDGKVAFQVVHDLGVGRNPEEILRVLQAFQEHKKTGDVCPARWTPGAKTMKPGPKESQEYFQSQSR